MDVIDKAGVLLDPQVTLNNVADRLTGKLWTLMVTLTEETVVLLKKLGPRLSIFGSLGASSVYAESR
jgi:hypothetical protein